MMLIKVIHGINEDEYALLKHPDGSHSLVSSWLRQDGTRDATIQPYTADEFYELTVDLSEQHAARIEAEQETNKGFI